MVEQLARIPSVVAVALGGSRAQGTHRADSDWDFGLYYRGTLDPEHIRALGYPGTVVAPGEWAYPMNGGAWLTVDDQKVDVLYRDLDDVERWIEKSERGEWELYRVPGYLAGMPSYTLVGELALGKVLNGVLPKPAFPEKLRETAPRRWRWEAEFALDHAEVHAYAGDAVPCLGKLSFAAIASAHAVLVARGEWTLNEKGIVEKARLATLQQLLATGPGDLVGLVEDFRAALAESKA